VGEQILISRPNLFGPSPNEIRDVVFQSLPYRLMAHTAEDLCEMCMNPTDMRRCGHADFKHGFVIYFYDFLPDFKIHELEAKVNEMIQAALPISYIDDFHVGIGGNRHPCTGPRIHVANTSQVKGFHLFPNFIYDRFHKRYNMVGCVGENSVELLQALTEKQQRPGWE
jgi:hypothetical protein